MPNAVRVSGVNHHPEFYRLCDRNGIIVWKRFPARRGAYMTDREFFNTHSYAERNGREQATTIIRQLKNHPSIVMWGIFSAFNSRGDNPVDYISELNLLAKRRRPLEADRSGEQRRREINFITDLIVWITFSDGRKDASDIAVWQHELHTRWNKLLSAVSYGAVPRYTIRRIRSNARSSRATGTQSAGRHTCTRNISVI